MKNTYLYIAACLLFLSISFTFDESGVTWLWAEKIQVQIILISISFILVGAYLFKRQTNRVAKD